MKTFTQWLESLQDRLGEIPTANDPAQLIAWGSNPGHAYKNPRQAQDMERKARGRAELINRKYNDQVRVYKTISPQDLDQKLSNIVNSVRQLSVSIGEKAKGLWNTELVLSGLGRIEYYYAKDVSTNTVDPENKSLERVPLTPLNPYRSHYDEAVVVGKDIKWDTLYYDPKIAQQTPELEGIAQKFNLKAIPTNQSGLPAPITYTQEREKTQKQTLDTPSYIYQ